MAPPSLPCFVVIVERYRICQGGADRYSSEDLLRMHGEALLSTSPRSFRTAVSSLPSHNPGRTSIVRHFVAALNSEYEARFERVLRRKKDRAAKRRAARRARRPSPTTVAVSDVVSRTSVDRGGRGCMAYRCTPSSKIPSKFPQFAGLKC